MNDMEGLFLDVLIDHHTNYLIYHKNIVL